MKRIRSSLRQVLVSLFLVYLAGLMLATDGCTRMARATWPSTYGWQGLHWAAAPWLSADRLARLHHWQLAGEYGVHAFLQQALLGEVFLCTP